MKLIKLANGDWVDPTRITSITVNKAYEGSGVKWPDKVIVKHDGTQSDINCESLQAAQMTAADLGNQVNKIWEARLAQLISDKANAPTPKDV